MSHIQHIAFIMDGNRRWAKENNLMPEKGHSEGAKRAKDVIEWALAHQLQYVSLFALSKENVLRDPFEVQYLWDLIRTSIVDLNDFLAHNKIRLLLVGDRLSWPNDARTALEELEYSTKHNNSLVVIIALCYSGQWDIDQAVQKAFELREPNWKIFLQTYNIPELDLLVRTGKEKRISNYYLYQIAYTELFFLDIFWPELTHYSLDKIIVEYYSRQRRFGTNIKIIEEIISE